MTPETTLLVGVAVAMGIVMAGPLAHACRRAGFVDPPGQGHKAHAEGVGLGGFLYALPWLGALIGSAGPGLLAGAHVVLLLGLAEDLLKTRGREIPWPIRLAGFVVASFLPLLDPAPPSVAGCLLLLAAVLAFNWADHADGVCAAMAAGPGIVLLVEGRTELAVPLGLLLALLKVNAWRGKGALLFLGDSGAQVLGFSLVAHALLDPQQGADPTLALAVTALPLADALRVVVARLRQGQAPWRPDAHRHFGHRLRARGVGRAAIASVALVAAIVMTVAIWWPARG